MSSQSDREMQLTLGLVKGDDSLNDRVITFKAPGGQVQAGRASRTERKQLIAAPDNLWINNPVISRSHAIIQAEVDPPAIYVEDAGSSHGTFVNKVNIARMGKTQLSSGDEVQFGDNVQRGNESFEPPVYRVQIKSIFKDPVPQRPAMGTGRSISVPDETDEESEMDESDSDAASVDSHSSPPHFEELEKTVLGSSSRHPINIDDLFHKQPTVIEIEEDMPSREPSEEYSPEEPAVDLFDDEVDDFEASADAYFDDANDSAVEEVVDYDDDDQEDDYEPLPPTLPPRPESPIYQPPSPSVAPPRVMTEFPNFFPCLPAVPMNTYSQGPFAQPPMGFNQLVSNHVSLHNSIPMDFNMSGTPVTNIHAQSQPVIDMHMDESCVWGDSPFQPAVVNSLTSSTQDFLVANTVDERARANKTSMSINSLINPPTTAGASAGTKRKAEDAFDEDEDEVEDEDEEVEEEEEIEEELAAVIEPEVQEQLAEELGSEAAIMELVTEDVKQAEITQKSLQAAMEKSKRVAKRAEEAVERERERPAKRRRTVGSHLLSAALGGVAVLAGLVCLPENYFG